MRGRAYKVTCFMILLFKIAVYVTEHITRIPTRRTTAGAGQLDIAMIDAKMLMVMISIISINIDKVAIFSISLLSRYYNDFKIHS
jgi:hypothetical protein